MVKKDGRAGRLSVCGCCCCYCCHMFQCFWPIQFATMRLLLGPISQSRTHAHMHTHARTRKHTHRMGATTAPLWPDLIDAHVTSMQVCPRCSAACAARWCAVATGAAIEIVHALGTPSQQSLAAGPAGASKQKHAPLARGAAAAAAHAKLAGQPPPAQTCCRRRFCWRCKCVVCVRARIESRRTHIAQTARTLLCRAALLVVFLSRAGRARVSEKTPAASAHFKQTHAHTHLAARRARPAGRTDRQTGAPTTPLSEGIWGKICREKWQRGAARRCC